MCSSASAAATALVGTPWWLWRTRVSENIYLHNRTCQTIIKENICQYCHTTNTRFRPQIKRGSSFSSHVTVRYVEKSDWDRTSQWCCSWTRTTCPLLTATGRAKELHVVQHATVLPEVVAVLSVTMHCKPGLRAAFLCDVACRLYNILHRKGTRHDVSFDAFCRQNNNGSTVSVGGCFWLL